MPTFGSGSRGTSSVVTPMQSRPAFTLGSRVVTAGPIDIINGTLAVTEVSDTSAISAGHGPNATLAVTEVSDTSAISAGHGPNATLAVTEAADTSSAVGGNPSTTVVSGGAGGGTAKARPFHPTFWPTPPQPPKPPNSKPKPKPKVKPATVVGHLYLTEHDDVLAAFGAFDPFHLLDDEELLLLV